MSFEREPTLLKLQKSPVGSLRRRSVRVMARPAASTSRIRAAATRPTMPGPGAPRRTRLPPRLGSCASNPSSGLMAASSSSAIRPARGVRWRSQARTPKDVAAIIAFAPGRGGRANDLPNRICAPHTLTSAAGEFGKNARVKVTWLVAANDSYFSPAFASAGRCVSRRRRQGGFSRAAGPRQRGALVAGNRRRRKTRRT